MSERATAALSDPRTVPLDHDELAAATEVTEALKPVDDTQVQG